MDWWQLVAPLAGAWIEIEALRDDRRTFNVAPLAGAWIEIRERHRNRLLH